MAYAEFPNINYDQLDYHELIGLYVEVRDKYEGTLKEIQDLSDRLTAYEADVDSRIAGSVENSMLQYRQIVYDDINRRFATIEQTVNNRLTAQDNRIHEFIEETTINICNFIGHIESDMDTFKREVNNKILMDFDTMMNFLEDVEGNFQNRQDEFEEYVQGHIDNIRETLPQEIDSIRYLWHHILKQGGMSALDWYHYTPFTAEDWNNSKITAEQWYTNSRRKLHWDKQIQKMFSPVSGDLTTVQVIIAELCAALRINGVTAAEYDAMKITADEFDRLFKTAGEYDWSGFIHNFDQFDQSN